MFTSRELVLAAMFLRVFQPTKYLSRAARYTPRPDANYTLGKFALILRLSSRQRVGIGVG